MIKLKYLQFQEDFLLFLKCQSPKVIPNGSILFIINGRKLRDPIGKENIYHFEVLLKAISYMVSKVKSYQILPIF
ncbi:SAM dependent carboxyl methyltransferase - like 10 [Theobroma cacao]|nr:SAM dependent carboxyl methyltransferase - like 10 [Theobroma cacao]